MEPILLIIIGGLIAYLVFKDIITSRERESMLLKLMSRDVKEYKSVVESEPEEASRVEEDVIIPIEEATYEQILKAK